jgi:hypothetical protein
MLWKRRNNIFSGNFVVVTVEKRQKKRYCEGCGKKTGVLFYIIIVPPDRYGVWSEMVSVHLVRHALWGEKYYI